MHRLGGSLLMVVILLAGCAEPAAEKLKKTPLGVEYKDLKEGDGEEAKKGDRVRVHYTGWLRENDRKFDSSHDHPGDKPFEFTLGEGEVIRGWEDGVAGMKVGGKRRLVIPYDLAYGMNGQGDIPPRADLIFEVELLEIVK